MHSPSAYALRTLDRYYIILVRTLEHIILAKRVLNITYVYICYCFFTNEKEAMMTLLLTMLVSSGGDSSRPSRAAQSRTRAM